MHDTFAAFGNVLSCKVATDEHGNSKGYGFVDVGDEEEQKKAIAALEGKEVAGRPIAVKIAVNTQEAEEELKGEKSEAAAAAEPESVVVAS